VFSSELPTQVHQTIQNQDVSYADSGGSGDAYTLSVTPAPTAYVAGQVFRFKANFANTAAATLNVNSLGAKTIKKLNGATDLAANDIQNGQLVEVQYDGTNFQMLSPVAVAAAGGGGGVIYKSVDEAVLDTTFQDDDELKFSVGANEKWIFDFVLFCKGPNTGDDFKVQFSGPTGARLNAAIYHPHRPEINPQTGVEVRGQTLTAIAQSSGRIEIEAIDTHVIIKGSISTDSTGGDVVLQWAKWIGSTADTRVKAGSYLFRQMI
jgi:hypothetical protein